MMKRAQIVSSIVVASLLFLLYGCKAKEQASGNAAKPAPGTSATSSNSTEKPNPATPPSAEPNNSNTSKESAASSKEAPKETAQLIGTYEAREVEDKGVVTLITQIKTVISFSAAGTYSRASQAKGKIYHSDSGQFRIEPPNKLVLTIQTSRKTILKPPVEKKHTFSLSADGDELRLTSDKGTTAVFRRVSKPKVS
jgi:flagellar basal body L-ring protein FlgH